MSDITDFIGGQIPIWASGATVIQWRYVISPTDGAIYQRRTATGSGTTDPADDTTNYVAASFNRITAIAMPGSQVDNGASPANFFARGATLVSVGAISVGVRTQLLSVTGRGELLHLSFGKNAADGGTFELIVDGRAIINGSIPTAANSTSQLCFVGSLAAGVNAGTVYPNFAALAPDQGVVFKRSLAVWFTPTTTASGGSGRLAHIIRDTA